MCDRSVGQQIEEEDRDRIGPWGIQRGNLYGNNEEKETQIENDTRKRKNRVEGKTVHEKWEESVKVREKKEQRAKEQEFESISQQPSNPSLCSPLPKGGHTDFT